MTTDNWKAAWITAGGLLKKQQFHIAMDVLQWLPGPDGSVGAIVAHPEGGMVQQFWPGRGDDEELLLDYGFYKVGSRLDLEGMEHEWRRLSGLLEARYLRESKTA